MQRRSARPGRRLGGARQPVDGAGALHRGAGEPARCRAAASGRNHQHWHHHRRAPGEAGGNLGYRPARLRGTGDGDHLRLKRPLEGTTVAGLEQGIARAFCTRQLAQLEAPVIKHGGNQGRNQDQNRSRPRSSAARKIVVRPCF
ncbi:MAG: hypothetical protein FJY47_08140 [Betaproteobacteria bacterium]|nr:hypothetical protein [Betaproteobacteria bacterium]